jgi:Prolipoprotein diacylglyceryl transferase
MANWVFIALMALILAVLFIWSFRTLPGERWQILCAVPVRKEACGTWSGLNLTYYGFFNAMALCAAVFLVIVLAGAAGIDLRVLAGLVCLLLGCCLPASRIIARWVEKKRYTFSVGAASFLGIVAGPWLVRLMQIISIDLFSIPFDIMTVLAALMVAYALGEGIGRLACISFGCCYGRPMDQMPRVIQRWFPWMAFTYAGATKKIAYAHRLEGKRIFAVQAITAVLYSTSALVGTLLILFGAASFAFVLCLAITQGWRFLSECFRSDYRGEQKISAYQWMSLISIPYGMLFPILFHSSGISLDVTDGLRLLWRPSVILSLQALWFLMFMRSGRSEVTGSILSFHVNNCRL